MSVELPILHFNDVYRVHQKYAIDPSDGTARYISAAQFARQLDDERAQWADSPGEPGGKEGLVLFSGDVFAPSVESTITRGSHMVPLMNRLSIAASCAGNHDFDSSWPHLQKLIGDCTFPWLLSNIVDERTGLTPPPLQEYLVLERCGLKIGIVGLVEADWIATIPSFPPNFKHQPMAKRARELSELLRGDAHGCDVVVALTHSRVNNDIALARDTGAVGWKDGETARAHGLDLILGGHDHMYYVGRGAAAAWDGWDRPDEMPGTEADEDCMIAKSGTDFRDLSSFALTLVPNPSYPASSSRKMLIKSVRGRRLEITPDSPTDDGVQALIDGLLKDIGKTLDKPACFTVAEWDCRSELVRTQESAVGNWMADVLLHSYADALEAQGGKIDIVFNCGGTIRGDSRYGPGVVTLGDLLEILPFEDPVVVIQMTGKAIWACLEGALSKYPAQEGRFPIVAGMEVEWDSRLPPGQRVKSVHLVSHHHRRRPKPAKPTPSDSPESDSDSDDVEDESTVQFFPHPQQGGVKVEVRLGRKGTREEIKREDDERLYTVVTREYMAEGFDGYDAMKGSKYLVDDESGLVMSAIIRQFLLGATFIARKRRLVQAHDRRQQQERQAAEAFLSPKTEKALDWNARDGAQIIHGGWRSVRNALRVARTEHMSSADECSGEGLRNFPSPAPPALVPAAPPATPPSSPPRPAPASPSSPAERSIDFFVQDRNRAVFRSLEDDVAVVAPFVDGRMRDLARS